MTMVVLYPVSQHNSFFTQHLFAKYLFAKWIPNREHHCLLEPIPDPGREHPLLSGILIVIDRLAFFLELRQNRCQLEFSKFDLGALCLQGNLPVVRCAMGTPVDHFPIDPDLDVVSQTLDGHRIPLARRLLGVVGQVENSSALAFGDAPIFLWSTSIDHVGYGDVFADAPKVARMRMIHLHLNGFGKHFIQSP